MSKDQKPVMQDTMTNTALHPASAATVNPVDTSKMLADVAAQANHAATHAAIHQRVVEASQQAADCTNYATAAMHVAYDLFTTCSQRGEMSPPIRCLEYACMAADSARSATGFVYQAAIRAIPPDLELATPKGTHPFAHLRGKLSEVRREQIEQMSSPQLLAGIQEGVLLASRCLAALHQRDPEMAQCLEQALLDDMALADWLQQTAGAPLPEGKQASFALDSLVGMMKNVMEACNSSD